MLETPRQHSMFHGALLNMIEDLIAGDAAFADDIDGCVQVIDVEVADTE